jgi:putative ABC transport system substrate-binding protein
MNRRDTVFAILALGAAPLAAVAQGSGKVWRIGMLESRSMALNSANLSAFLKSMQELGYVEGRDFVMDYRSADGRLERYPELATEMVRGKVDLIVARGTPATDAAKKAAGTIPVVTTATAEPLRFAASLARPGGNVTGLTPLNTELIGKRVELLREIIPGLARIAYLGSANSIVTAGSYKELERTARSVGIQVLFLDVRKQEDFGPEFERAVKQRVGALMVSINTVIETESRLIAQLGAKHRLPVMYQSREFVVDGGLVSYSVSYPDLYRRAAVYVDKILKGAKPGDLPIEGPTKFDLAINLKAAKALGLAIPPSIVFRADLVIE